MNPAPYTSGALAFCLTLLLVPVIIRACSRWQLLDRPGPLKVHERPVPRLGGVAIVIAIFCSALFVSPAMVARSWPFLLALALVWITSLVDDLGGLSAAIRLAAQIGAGMVLWCDGWRVPWPNPTSALALNAFATCFLVVAFINSMNFLDGSDGVAAGVSAIVAGAYVLVRPSHDNIAVLLAPAVIGSCLSFLIFNFPPAKLFMGDSGSATLGLCLAFLGLDFWRFGSATPARTAFPLLVVALPLLDAALAIARRLARGSSPLYGDRAHFYDLLLARGWRSRPVALACYGISALFAAIGCYGLKLASATFWVLAGLAMCALLASAVSMGSLRKRNSNRQPRKYFGGIRKTAAEFDRTLI